MNYVLTKFAEADLSNISRYTRRQWGSAQTRNYNRKLKQGCARLAAGQEPFTNMELDLRMTRCEHHYIFCLQRTNAPALIVAILHERMNITAHLAERLKMIQ
jgi:plasmid stabilization system protein ParE